MLPADLLVLPNDLDMRPVRHLAPEIRARLACQPDDVAIARPSHRGTAKLIDHQSAALLRTFAAPRTVSDAVLEYASANGVDPLICFDRAYPFLERMIAGGFLVVEGSGLEGPPLASLPRGTPFGRWTLLSCVHLLNDVEVYQVRDASGTVVALKIARTPAERAAHLMKVERQVLRRLKGDVAPKLLEAGRYQRRPYLVTAWRAGIDAATLAAEFRSLPPKERHRRLLELSVNIALAYARLHARGVLHGDVHPKNIRVDAGGTVTLLDFGWSRFRRPSRNVQSLGRAGAGLAYEPEFASAVLAGRRPPPVTPSAEQYILASLLYRFWTGALYRRFSLDVPGALRQVATEPPSRFVDVGAPSAPEVEAILRRALGKRPATRFASMASLARAFQGIQRSSTGERLGNSTSPRRIRKLARTSEEILSHLRVVGPSARESVSRAPTCSVASGAAGLAYSLARLATIRSDPHALAWADVWVTRAHAQRASAPAFHGEEGHLAPQHVGEISLWHAEPGVHLVRALVASARSDRAALAAAVDAYADAVHPVDGFIDLTHGVAGLLLGCAVLVEATSHATRADRLMDAGRRARRSLWSALSREPSVLDRDNRMNLGLAHGWGGVLYATLQWCRVTRSPVPHSVRQRLDDVARCAEPYGRGVRWPWLVHGAPLATRDIYAPGWCNGAAGLVHLFLLAHSLLGDERYRGLAVSSAWNAWESEVDAGPNLCCGFAGQAYALLAIYRQTKSPDWLTRAVSFAERAVVARARWNGGEGPRRPESLYFGDVGIALLLAELERPESASMPLMEWG